MAASPPSEAALEELKTLCRASPRVLNQVLEELSWDVADVAEVLTHADTKERVRELLAFFKPRGGDGSAPAITINRGSVPRRGAAGTLDLSGTYLSLPAGRLCLLRAPGHRACTLGRGVGSFDMPSPSPLSRQTPRNASCWTRPSC